MYNNDKFSEFTVMKILEKYISLEKIKK